MLSLVCIAVSAVVASVFFNKLKDLLTADPWPSIIDPWGPLSVVFMQGQFVGWPIIGFIVAAAVVYTLTIRNEDRQASLLSFVRFAFPTKVYVSTSFFIDCVSYVVNALFSPLLSILAFGITGEVVCRSLLRWSGDPPILMPSGFWVGALEFVLIFLAEDFAEFLAHYLLHRPLLWPIHSTHHSAESLNLFTTFRKHPFEVLFITPIIAGIMGVTIGLLLYFTGAEHMSTTMVSLLAVLNAIYMLMNYLFHSSMWIRFGKLESIFLSPAVHQIHHSALEKHRDVNFGGLLIIWDRLFNTAYIPKTHEDFPFGISEQERGQGNPHRTVRGLLVT